MEGPGGRERLGAGWDTRLGKTTFEPAQAPGAALGPEGNGHGLVWTEEATARLNRVPAGFMRDMTREEVERVAGAKGAATSAPALCEGGRGPPPAPPAPPATNTVRGAPPPPPPARAGLLLRTLP